MYKKIFDAFLASGDTLRVYDGEQLAFSSTKDRLLPLLDYLGQQAQCHKEVVLMDKLMGNAAALLSIKAGCREVYSPLGSQLAAKTLDGYGVKHHLVEVVPHVLNASGDDMCPMEKLSLGKGPQEFYEAVMSIISKSSQNG